MPDLHKGQRIGRTHVVDRLLGEGAFAQVYRVEHRFLGRQAMKILRNPGMTLDEIEDVLGEAVLLSRMGHPNIVRVFDANVAEIGGEVYGYFTMEYVPGGTLFQYWQSYRDHFMPVEVAVDIMKQVCAGVGVAHAEEPPIVHRDIKPLNILIGYDGGGMRVKVSDFGLAKRVNPLTLLASARGTPSFKPPEAFKNIDSCAADVWSLGTTLYLLLTDSLPYLETGRDDDRQRRDFDKPLRPPSFYNARVDSSLDALVLRCLARDPGERYEDANALLRELRRWENIGHDKNATPEARTRTLKNALGKGTSPDKEGARAAVSKALEMARNPAKLMMAADLLEEAINRDPDMRERYKSQVQLWRRGVCM